MTLDKSLLRVDQKESIKLILQNPFFALFNTMGAGKTVVTLTAFEELLRKNKIKKLLIVSTLLVSRETWPDEIKTWDHTKRLAFSFINGTPKKREEKAKSPAPIHLINQENFVSLVEFWGPRWPYDALVFDDATGFKKSKIRSQPKTAICIHAKDCPIFEPEGRTKACAVLCSDLTQRKPRLSRFGAVMSVRPKLKRLLHLTGTPSSKELLDLWPLVCTLDGGERLERSFYKYKLKYFNRAFNGFGWTLKPGAEEKIHGKIKDLCALVESTAELPPLHVIKRNIKLGPKGDKLYAELEKEFMIEVEGQEIDAINAGVLAGKLLQVCGGGVYVNDLKEWATLHDAKIKEIQKVLDTHPGEPILVGFNFKHELERLKAHFPLGVDIRELPDAVSEWNAGKVPLMFVHPLSAGHGLNLQKGPGRVLVWFGLNWSLELNKQLNKRLHRPGQKREVYIYYIIAKGKIDDRVVKTLEKKDATQTDLLNAVRVDLNRRVKKH